MACSRTATTIRDPNTFQLSVTWGKKKILISAFNFNISKFAEAFIYLFIYKIFLFVREEEVILLWNQV